MEKKKLFEIFATVKDGTLNTLIFSLPDIIRKNDISKYKNVNPNIPDTSQYLGTGRFNIDVPLGIEFDVIFSRKNPADYRKTHAILKWVNVNPTIETNHLPAGYSGMCLIDFPDGKPDDMFKNLADFNEDTFGKNYEELFLTTQAVMDKIIERL